MGDVLDSVIVGTLWLGVAWAILSMVKVVVLEAFGLRRPS
jgi:hypothetical protein